MGDFSDDINEAERELKKVILERKRLLIFLEGFEEGWKQIKMYFAKYPVVGQLHVSPEWAEMILKKDIPSLWNWHPEWKNMVAINLDWLKTYGRMVGYLIGIMRFDPVGLIRRENVESAIEVIQKLISEPLAGRKVDVIIKKMLKNNWIPRIESQLNQLSEAERQNYYRLIKSL